MVRLGSAPDHYIFLLNPGADQVFLFKKSKTMFQKIKKRDGRIVQFDSNKIKIAIQKAGEFTDEFDEKVAGKLSLKVLNLASETIKNKVPKVEEIQDIVEEVLLSSTYKQTAKAYVIYREQHNKLREIANTASIDLVGSIFRKIRLAGE